MMYIAGHLNILSHVANPTNIDLRSSLLRHGKADASIALVMTQSQPSVSSASFKAIFNLFKKSIRL